MIHDIEKTLPDYGGLTADEIEAARKELETKLEAVVEEWILKMGIREVEATIHTNSHGRNGRSKETGTFVSFINLYISANVKLDLGGGVTIFTPIP